MDKIWAVYTWFPRTNRKADIANVCSIVDKYFSDALVDSGVIPDDNYEHIVGYSHRFGGVDKDNPRVEITLINLNYFIEDNMKFNIDLDVIDGLVRKHIESLIELKDGVELELSFEDNTCTATIIDTNTGNEETDAKETVKAPVKRASKVARAAAKKVAASTPVDVKKDNEEPAITEELDEEDDAGVEVPTEVKDNTEPEEPTETSESTDTKEVPKPVNKLFANMKKP